MREQWRQAQEAGIALAAVDLPGVGELGWETDLVNGARLHDTARACLWLGYSLVGEWAEALAALCLALRSQTPAVRIRVVAEKETVFAALLCLALYPEAGFELTEYDCPISAADPHNDSLAWCVPGFLPWGDLPLLRDQAQRNTPIGDL